MDRWVKLGVVGTYLCFLVEVLSILSRSRSVLGMGERVNPTALILLLSALIMVLTMLAYKDKWPFKTQSKSLPEPLGESPSHAVQPVQVVPRTPSQRLTLRVLDGLIGRQSNDPTTIVILLNVRVDGPPAEVTSWELELSLGKDQKMAYPQPIPKGAPYWSAASVNEAPSAVNGEAQAISSHVPARGWLLFTLSYAQKEFDDHIFGATFILTAVENESARSRLEKPPGQWLHRASIQY